MKVKAKVLFAALALVVGASAHATVVSASQNQTVNGQNFTFALATPGYAANTTATLNLRLLADFNGAFNDGEVATVFVEGVSVGTFSPFSAAAYNVVDYRIGGGSNINTLAFSLEFLLGASATNGYLADGDLDVMVDFHDAVTAQCGWGNSSNCSTGWGAAPSAQVSLTYQESVVPEPASMALFGFGLLGLAAARRRKQA
jgi:hypothetical protein